MSGQNNEPSFATCFVQVLDANDDPIQGVSVFIHESQGLTNLEGKVTILVPELPPYGVRLIAYHPSYVREEAQFTDSIFSGPYNNALVQRSPGSKIGDVNLTLRLGRFASAPTRKLSDKELLAQAKKGQDARGVLIEAVKGREGEMTYRHTNLLPELVKCAKETLTPNPEADDKSMGWSRLNHEAIKIDSPENHGRLFFIQSQKTSTSPKPLMLCIWSPTLKSEDPVKELDMIFFYHPSTQPAKAIYPYGLTIPPNDTHPEQSYSTLASKYMQRHAGLALIYPLIARQRNAIIIFPISDRGTWDPFLAQEGVWRMCKEVSVFLHRECRTSARFALSQSSDKSQVRAGGSLRDLSLNEVRNIAFGQPPRIRKLAISFFSQGCAPAKSVMKNYSLASVLTPHAPLTSDTASASFPANLWGCPRQRPEDFSPIFSDVWDLDGFHADTGGWAAYLAELDKWYHAQPQRSFHLCHSSGRSARRPLSTLAPGAKKDPDDKTGLWAKLIPDPDDIPYKSVDPKQYVVKPIEEVHGRRWSVVAMDSAYLEYRVAGKRFPNEFPLLLMPIPESSHLATLKIGWGHSILLGNFGKDVT